MATTGTMAPSLPPSSATTSQQEKFVTLRRRLDQLGFRQPFGVESLPLVERLFADLLHTTESLRAAKLRGGATADKGQHVNGSADVCEPYRNDNARLVKENNELHQKLILQKEQQEAAVKDVKASLRRMEHENADLRFLNNQYVHKIRTLERETKLKSDRIVALQEKNFHAVVHTPGGRKKNIPFRRQRMELDGTVPPSSGTLRADSPVADDPYVADLLRVADDNIASLRLQLDSLTSERDALEGKVNTFRKQVDARDAEIDRMSRLLSGGRPYDVVALEARNQGNERLISHLNIQVDYLQQQVGELQAQLAESQSREHNAATRARSLNGRNDKLAKELDGVDLMAKRLQLDKDTVIRAADEQIAEAKENIRLSAECIELKKKLEQSEMDNLRLGELVDRVQEDKRKLCHRVNQLTATERELILEMDCQRHRSPRTKPNVKTAAKTAAVKTGMSKRVENLIASAENERDYWKNEADTLQRLLGLRGGAVGSPVSPGRRARPVTPTLSPRRAVSPAADRKLAAHYEAIVRDLEEERDHYRDECEILKAKSLTKLRSRSLSPQKRNMVTDSSELIRVRRERDDLQNLLDKFERHMAEIQANVKVLTSERDNLNILYEEAKEELARLRCDMVTSPHSGSKKMSLAAKAVLRRVEDERDEVSDDLLHMTSERDSLRERLKIATETQLAEKARLEQHIEDLMMSSSKVEAEQNSAQTQVCQLENHCAQLEKRIEQLCAEARETQDERSQCKATAQQMRLLAEQAEASVRTLQSELRARDAQLASEREQTARLQCHLADARRGDEEQRRESTQLRVALESLDRDKDSLQAAADERAEQLARHEAEMLKQTRIVTELKSQMADMEENLCCLQQTVADREREIASLRRQLDANGDELTEVSRGREVALRENRRLQDDLSTMTRENQTVNEELSNALGEKDQLKLQVHNYICELKRVEDLLAAKERERSDLLEHYRTLSLEAERYETATHQLESQGSSLRLEIVNRDSETRRLQSRVEELQRELVQQKDISCQYEQQVSTLSESLSRFEQQQRVMENEKQGLHCEHATVRDLCAQLEATRDGLQRQLAAKMLDIEKLECSLDESRREAEVERGRVTVEQASVRKLESLLHSSRDRDFQADMAQQECLAEVQLLRDRLALNESKLDSQSREIISTRKCNLQLESEAERLRRQLTNERFERERTVQELHRHGLPPPGEVRSTKNSMSPVNPSSSRPASTGRPSPLLNNNGRNSVNQDDTTN